MRFGKRLAEVTRGRAHEPYVSYKELKHTVGRLSSLIGGAGSADDDDDASSLDESCGPVAGASLKTSPSTPACASSGPRPSQDAPARPSRLEAHQREFFRRIDADVAQAKAYVQNTVAALEAQVGDWQASAILAGVLFTPDQLEEISSQLPFPVHDQQLLVEWMTGLQQGEKRQDACEGLLERYSAIATSLNGLLHYIEVNLTAVRKIFKKFEKKVPLELRIQNVRDYQAHHDLYMPAMQDLLITAVHLQQLVFSFAGGAKQDRTAIAISQIGSESRALLSQLRGPAAMNEMLGAAATAPIDVYAKPAADLNANGSASGSAAQAQARRPAEGLSSGSLPSDAAQQRPGSTPFSGPQQQAAHVVPLAVLGPGPGPEDPPLAAPATASQAGRAKGQPARHRGPSSSLGQKQQDFGEEMEAGRQGRGRHGGRGNRGGGRGRKGGGGPGNQGQGGQGQGQGQGQDGMPGRGGGARLAFSRDVGPEEGSARPMQVLAAPGAAAAVGAGPGMGYWPAGAVPLSAFASFPAKGGKGPGMMVGRGGGGGGRGGLVCNGVLAGHPVYGSSNQGTAPTMDPHWIAAMMPMFWPSPALLQ